MYAVNDFSFYNKFGSVIGRFYIRYEQISFYLGAIRMRIGCGHKEVLMEK